MLSLYLPGMISKLTFAFHIYKFTISIYIQLSKEGKLTETLRGPLTLLHVKLNIMPIFQYLVIWTGLCSMGAKLLSIPVISLMIKWCFAFSAMLANNKHQYCMNILFYSCSKRFSMLFLSY